MCELNKNSNFNSIMIKNIILVILLSNQNRKISNYYTIGVHNCEMCFHTEEIKTGQSNRR